MYEVLIVLLILFTRGIFCVALQSPYATAVIVIVHHVCIPHLWSITAENKYRSASKNTVKKVYFLYAI